MAYIYFNLQLLDKVLEQSTGVKCKNMTCSIIERNMEDALNNDLIYNDQFMLKRHHILRSLPSFTASRLKY